MPDVSTLTTAERIARARAQRSVLAALRRREPPKVAPPRPWRPEPEPASEAAPPAASREAEPLTEVEARVLWACVLRQAVADADSVEPALRRAARAWLVSEQAQRLAEAVGLGPDAWRWGVRRVLLGRVGTEGDELHGAEDAPAISSGA